MSIKGLWVNPEKPTISFELFPGRDEKASKKLDKVINKLASLTPDFVSVTFGAGGSTREGSFQLVEKLSTTKQLKVLPYVAAYGLSPQELTTVLDNYYGLGIRNVFCVRGDQPEDGGFQPHPNSFAHASRFIEFVGEKYDFFIGAAGYPEGHKHSADKEQDLEYLKLKVDKGAGFIISQFCFDSDAGYFCDFLDRCRSIDINVPILAGVMPIYSVKMMESLAAMCGATICPEVRHGLEQLPANDKEALQEFAVGLAVKQCRSLIDNGVQGIHFYTMDRSKTVTKIIKGLAIR